MSDRNIDQSLRKPRRTKGTPFYRQRHYYSLGFLGLSAICGWLYLSWSEARKLGKDAENGKFDYPDSLKEHIASHKVGYDPAMLQVLLKLQQKADEKVTTSQPQSGFSKLFSQPDV
ncbi:hypothetical protein PPYR_00930 [Photinus pyralis]|uniref:Uncharacterized protein n=1 Tax=Photinus pyralis TaxID=7054 RepID=A0A1Y1M1L9_PHOPY|nr:hypothetical protein PPYR_06367 [Photinus pyralis]KAB0803960.1 hypothetical protein PPYR_00930 [Photinus pyralis]